MNKKETTIDLDGLPAYFGEIGLGHTGTSGKEITLIISRADGVFELKINGNTYSADSLDKLAEATEDLITPKLLEEDLREALNGKVEKIEFSSSRNNNFEILGENVSMQTPHPLVAEAKFLQNWGVRRDFDLFKLGIEGVRKEYAIDYYRNNFFLDVQKKENIQKFINDLYKILSDSGDLKNEVEVFRCLLGCDLLGLEDEIKLFAKKINLKNLKSDLADQIKNILLKFKSD